MTKSEAYRDVLRSIRMKLKLTMEDVCEGCKVMVCNYECAQRMPREKTLKRLLKFYGVRYEVFLDVVAGVQVAKACASDMVEIKWKEMKYKKLG